MTQITADYNDFDYKTNFWLNNDRRYEDLCDRIALRKLLPKTGYAIADICGGYGRLVNEYFGRFKEVHIFDYAKNLLEQAVLDHGNKVITTQGSVYELPYKNEQFDTIVMVRASHHLRELPKAIQELARVTKKGGTLIIEIANKRNILEVFRFLFGKSKMEPFSLQPTSRNEKGFYNFHPKYVEDLFVTQGLEIKAALAASLFRQPFLKRLLGFQVLGIIEQLLQRPMGYFKLSPSTFYLLEKK